MHERLGTVDRTNIDLAGDTNDAKYVRSYLWTRLAIGLVGFLLPTLLFIGEDWFLNDADAFNRDSLSAYYHTAQRDIFVGAMCVVGFMLIIYMFSDFKTWEFWISFAAGICALALTFVPTGRKGALRPASPEDAIPLCGSGQAPLVCSPMQITLGEQGAQNVHMWSSFAFIALLAGIAVVFGIRELTAPGGSKRAASLHFLCVAVMAVAGVVLAVREGGADLGFTRFKTLYVVKRRAYTPSVCRGSSRAEPFLSPSRSCRSCWTRSSPAASRPRGYPPLTAPKQPRPLDVGLCWRRESGEL